LNELREGWLNPQGVPEAELAKRTLTNLYNTRPSWLAQNHERLDRAVLDAYGWPHDIVDDDLLSGLLILNLERESLEGRAGEEPGQDEQLPLATPWQPDSN
jgi:hypothetical protein